MMIDSYIGWSMHPYTGLGVLTLSPGQGDIIMSFESIDLVDDVMRCCACVRSCRAGQLAQSEGVFHGLGVIPG